MSQKLARNKLDEKIDIELARRSFVDFCAYVIRDEDGNRIVPAAHQIAFDTHMRYCWSIGKDCGILSPFSFAKTKWLANALPLYLLGQNPNLRILIISAAEDQAKLRMQEIQRVVEENVDYQNVFPHVKPDYSRPWTQNSMNVRRTTPLASVLDHSVRAFGYTAKAGNGVRGDVIIFDDVVSEDNASSEQNRRTVTYMIDKQWIGRGSKRPVRDMRGNLICPGTIFVFIGTRYNPEDYYQTALLSRIQAYCTMIQRVSDDLTHLDLEIIGSLKEPPHPLIAQYENWKPNAV